MPLPDIVRTDLEQHLSALETALGEATTAAADAVDRHETLLDRVTAYREALRTDEQTRLEAIDPVLLARGVRAAAGPVWSTGPVVGAGGPVYGPVHRDGDQLHYGPAPEGTEVPADRTPSTSASDDPAVPSALESARSRPTPVGGVAPRRSPARSRSTRSRSLPSPATRR